MGEYVHAICFQFIQILLMIITQNNVPNSIIHQLENEFRCATSITLNKIFLKFLAMDKAKEGISETLALQLYFDVNFARLILANDASMKCWQEIVDLIESQHI